ncbi:MAG: hypothetical protein J6N45_09390 [Alphaproteobacteria bacterium]|nr:hypothetical protein [Alphaproteobacteria bacterium]
MKKIIIDPTNHRAIEVMINDGFGARMGMNALSYRQLVMNEKEVLNKLKGIIKRQELPKMVMLLPEIYPEFREDIIRQRISETLNVLGKVTKLMEDGFHVAVINGMLDVTCGHGGNFGDVFCSRFYPLCDKDCREDFWGTRWELPCFITMGLLEDMMNNVNVDTPTAEDLKKSKVIEVIKTYQCPQETLDKFIASYQA